MNIKNTIGQGNFELVKTFCKCLLIFMSMCLSACSQSIKTESANTTVSFDSLIKHFIENKSEVWLPMHEEDTIKIEISDNPIVFELKEMILERSKNSKYFEFPLSFSVIYKNRLVSLFEQEGFICFSIPEMKRDIDFEKKINTKNFQYHWILDNKLVGISNGKYYTLNTENVWVKYTETVPFKNRPKLFEDSLYIAFCDCHGEWGGTAYFYNKKTKNIHFTEATCAKTIFKKNDTYFILSELGHMIGNTDLKSVLNPSELPIIEPKNVGKMYIDYYKNGEFKSSMAWGCLDKSGKSNTVFDYSGMLIFSTFVYQGIEIYMVHCNERTFFAEIENNSIKIVNPLFNNDLYTHETVTTNYDKIILINLSTYYGGKELEKSCMLIVDNQLIKVDWNRNYDY